MDAVIVASGIPEPNDPMYTNSNGRYKALLEIAGKPMFQWVLDAVSDASEVENIIIVGLPKTFNVTCSKPLYMVPDRGRALQNAVAGMKKSVEIGSTGNYILVVSSAIPAIQGNMVDNMLAAAKRKKGDIYYSVCSHRVIESHFPGVKRAYLNLEDGDFCLGGMCLADINLLSDSPDMELFGKLVEGWKNPRKQIATIGWGALALSSLRIGGLDKLNAQASQRLHIKCQPVIWSDAEPCMIVDDPHNWGIVHDYLTRLKRKAKAESRKSDKVKDEIKTTRNTKAITERTKARSEALAKSEKTQLIAASSKGKVKSPARIVPPTVTATLIPEAGLVKQAESVLWKLGLQNHSADALQSVVFKRGDEIIEQIDLLKAKDGRQIEFSTTYDMTGIGREFIDITAVTKSGQTLFWRARGEVHVQRVIKVFGGLEFVLVPKGSFIMGSKVDDDTAFEDEKPRHAVDLPQNYWIARYPVTNAQFARFVESSRYRTTAEQKGSGSVFKNEQWQEVSKASWRKPFGSRSKIEGKENHPVTLVSWHDAQEYCRWLNETCKGDLPDRFVFRLPTEAEWEKAARGEDALKFPWGNKLPEGLQLNSDRYVGNTTSVDKFSPQGDSPYGVADMAGNVWEWTNSLFQGYPYKADDGREDPNSSMPRVLRGGSFLNSYQNARCAARSSALPETCISYYGFRVAVAPPLPL